MSNARESASASETIEKVLDIGVEEENTSVSVFGCTRFVENE